MDSTTDALVQLVEELTARVDQLERENESLRSELDSAAQALAEAPDASACEDKAEVVPEEVADKTVEALHKAGALSDDQLAEGRNILLTDAQAPHRLLCGLLNGGFQVKTASAESVGDVYGGRLANPSAPKTDAQSDCLDRMAALLHMD